MELKANNRSPAERLVSLMAICICLYTLWTFSLGGKSQRSAAFHVRRPTAGDLRATNRRQVVFSDGVEQVKDLPFDVPGAAGVEDTSPLDEEEQEEEESQDPPLGGTTRQVNHSAKPSHLIVYD